MIGPRDRTLIDAQTEVSHWPGLIDLVTSALMVFVLVTFFQTIFDPAELEAFVTRAQQASFLEQFEEEFGSEIAAGKITVVPHLSYLQITFSDQVLFDPGEHRLDTGAQRLLRRCADLFARASDSGYRQIQVEGHTDSTPLREGSEIEDNWELSASRALSVVRFLVGTGVLAADPFSANGYADQRPVVPNDTEAGRARNRRIEMRLFFALPRTEGPGAS